MPTVHLRKRRPLREQMLRCLRSLSDLVHPSHSTLHGVVSWFGLTITGAVVFVLCLPTASQADSCWLYQNNMPYHYFSRLMRSFGVLSILESSIAS